MIKSRAYARIGIMGNPSDGFYGKTIAASIKNFHAEVTLTESTKLCIQPHPKFDATDFATIQSLASQIKNNGCHGGIRLIYAACKKFVDYCVANDIELHDKNFTVAYDTNIPRQVGLGGSTAIITALWSALMEFYNISDEVMPLALRPGLLLAVETDELGINAGLQDRVAIVYGGIIYMNFDEHIMNDIGRGVYERLTLPELPNFFVAYSRNFGRDSGRMHNPIRQRFNAGDTDILSAMTTFADYATIARKVLVEGDFVELGKLMRLNFILRRKIYGDAAIGNRNLKLVGIAERFGLPVKFPGSGGSVIGLYENEYQLNDLRHEYKCSGFYCESVVFAEPARAVD